LEEVKVSSKSEGYNILEKGSEEDSRDFHQFNGKLFLVDLAGRENVGR
jgi:hypothetical protein